MIVEKFPVEGLALIHSKSFPDNRGFFCERFKASVFQEAGLPHQFVQDNFSRSNSRVLRGLHYQWDKPQGKLVTCLRGRIFDVAVDIRVGSPTFGQVTTVELSGSEPRWFWIPAGFAHGFCVLGDEEADVFYKCDNEYSPKCEAGIRFDDQHLNIHWPQSNLQVSQRDAEMQTFEVYQKDPKFFWKK